MESTGAGKGFQGEIGAGAMESKTTRRHAVALLAVAPLLVLLQAGRTLADQPSVLSSETSVLSSETAVRSSLRAVSDKAPDLADTVSDPAVDPTPTVSDVVSGATDTVSDVASGATGAVSGTTDAVSGATGPVSGTASGATGLDASSGAGAGTREGSTRMVGGGGTGGEGADGDGQNVGGCDPQTSTCIGGPSEDGALADAVRRILSVLAQTGLPLVGWVALAVGLVLLGSLALLRTRRGGGKEEPQELRHT
jgi:hypothetical protein